jgi:hypothetical protein
MAVTNTAMTMKRRLRRLFYNLICLTGQPCAKAGIQGYRTSLALDPRFRGEGDLVFVSDDRNQP